MEDLGRRETAEGKWKCPVWEESIHTDQLKILLGKYNFLWDIKN